MNKIYIKGSFKGENTTFPFETKYAKTQFFNIFNIKRKVNFFGFLSEHFTALRSLIFFVLRDGGIEKKCTNIFLFGKDCLKK